MPTENPHPEPARLRKRPIAASDRAPGGAPPPDASNRPLDVASLARIFYSSEAPEYPVDNLFDGSTGPDGSRWKAAEPDRPERIELAFDAPQRIRRVILEVAESAAERTQEVALHISTDGGHTFEEIRRQDYTFSPRGSRFQREEWTIGRAGVTHLRLDVIPNKNGHGTASLTALRLEA